MCTDGDSLANTPFATPAQARRPSRHGDHEAPLGRNVVPPYDRRHGELAWVARRHTGVDHEPSGAERGDADTGAPAAARRGGDLTGVHVEATHRRQACSDRQGQLGPRAQADVLGDGLAKGDLRDGPDAERLGELLDDAAHELPVASHDLELVARLEHEADTGPVDGDAQAAPAASQIRAEIGEAQVEPAAGVD